MLYFKGKMHQIRFRQLMPLPLTVTLFSKIQTGFAFLVPAHPESPGQMATKRVCVGGVWGCGPLLQFGVFRKRRPQNFGFFNPTPCPRMSTFAKPLPTFVDVHFIWSHFSTVSLSSDTGICSQYSQYTLKIDLFLFENAGMAHSRN